MKRREKWDSTSCKNLLLVFDLGMGSHYHSLDDRLVVLVPAYILYHEFKLSLRDLR
jgi:hypothetical protein